MNCKHDTSAEGCNKPNLPPRFREKAFRRYETAIAAAIQAYPKTFEVNPSTFGLSAVTVAQRLRDAKKSYLDNNWVSTMIDRKTFERCHDDLIVRETMDGMVKIGPSKEATLLEVQHHNLAEQFGIGPQMPTSSILDMTDCDASEIDFLCLLASKRALAVKVKVSIDASLVDVLYDQYDINLDRQEDGNYILT